MKICYFIGSFPTTSETFIVNQINDMIDRGHDVHIYSVYKNDLGIIHNSIKKYDLLNKVSYAPIAGKGKIRDIFSIMKNILCNIHHIDFNKIKELIKSKNRNSLYKFLRYPFFLQKHNFDVIHAHFGPNVANLSIMFSDSKVKGISKLIGTFHGADLRIGDLNKNKKLYKNLHKNIDHFTVNNEYLESLLKLANPNIKKVTQLPVGLDIKYLETLYKKKKK